MPANYANPKERAMENMLSQSKVRLFDPSTQDYLHLSGTGVTRDVNLSWLGFKHQSATLEQRAASHGEAWPFITVARNNPHAYEPDKRSD